MADAKPAVRVYSGKHLERLTLIFGLGVFVILVLAGLPLTDGLLVYPLDDPYIHLSMAEQIMHGGYGINPGEYASADSSILFPVLLAPFSGTLIHPYLPLFYNTVGLGFSLVLLAKIIWESGFPKNRLMLALLVFAPIALNFQGLALLGMEHMLQVAIVLMALLGLMRWLDTARLNWMLVTAILIGPLIRYELLGLSLTLSLALMTHGRAKIGAVLALAAVAPLVGFGMWLQSLGLSLLPNSVLAKAPNTGPDTNALWVMLSSNFGPYGNRPFALLFVGASGLLLAIAAWRWNDRQARVLALVAAAVGFGHAVLGKFGWLNRYEIYALVYVSLSMLVLLPRGRYVPVGFGVATLWGVAYYGSLTLLVAVYGPANIYSQQWQMGRLARAWDAPVLVNDIGLVSYQNENNVIDLYGLASTRALSARSSNAPNGWPNEMAIDENAGLAMGYDDWLSTHLAPGWVRVAYLDLRLPVATLPTRVTIYATSPDMVEPVLAVLEPFASTLPEFAKLEMVGADALQ